MTMIEKSMKASQSAEQLSKPKEEVRAKTVVVNVELDGQAKRDSNDTNAVHVKDRVAALQALVVDKSVPIAKIDSLDKEEVLVLSRNEELPHIALEAKPVVSYTKNYEDKISIYRLEPSVADMSDSCVDAVLFSNSYVADHVTHLLLIQITCQVLIGAPPL